MKKDKLYIVQLPATEKDYVETYKLKKSDIEKGKERAGEIDELEQYILSLGGRRLTPEEYEKYEKFFPAKLSLWQKLIRWFKNK